WLTDPGRQIRMEERDRRDRMRLAAQVLQTAIHALEDAHELEATVEAERAGAETYWRALVGIPVRWAPGAVQNVPQHWLLTQPRESYRTGNRYGATDPT